MLMYEDQKVADMKLSELIKLFYQLRGGSDRPKTPAGGTITRTRDKGYLITLPAYAKGTSIEIIYDFDTGEDPR